MTVIRGPWAGGLDGTPWTRPERRAVSRLRVLVDGKVYWEEGQRTGCSVQNLSERGARIRIPDGAILPDLFHLMVPKTASGHAAEVVWRSRGSLGVEFWASYELNDAWPIELEVRRDWSLVQRREISAQIAAATAPTKA